MAEADLWDYQKTDPVNKAILSRVVHDILNILEDGYIENRMLLGYPGILGTSLEAVRASDHKDAPTIEELIEQEEEGGHIWLSIRSALLSYMLWGELNMVGHRCPMSVCRRCSPAE